MPNLIVKLISDFLILFRRWCRKLNPYELPSRRTITRKYLPQMFSRQREDVFEEVRGASAVCLTTDISHYVRLNTYNKTTKAKGKGRKAQVRKAAKQFYIKGN